MTNTKIMTPEVEKTEINRTIGTIAERYGGLEGKVKESLGTLSINTIKSNNLDLFKNIDLLLKTFPNDGKNAIEIVDILTDISLRVPSNGFSKPSYVTLTNFIDTAKLFKENNYRMVFIEEIGNMVKNTDKNDPSRGEIKKRTNSEIKEIKTKAEEKWCPVLRLTLESACNVIKVYLENGKEQEASEIAGTFAKSSATLYRTHILRDVIEFHDPKINNTDKEIAALTPQMHAFRRTELDDSANKKTQEVDDPIS